MDGRRVPLAEFEVPLPHPRSDVEWEADSSNG